MAASPGVSCIISALLSLLLMASMQFFKVYLTSSRLSTLFTGYLGSIVFMLTLTSINNFEMASFGKQFQSKYTEVVISMLIALFAVSLVHRVAVTTCFLFSIGTLYFLNRISTKVYQTNSIAQSNSNTKNISKKRK